MFIFGFQRPQSRISEIIEGDEDEDTPEGSQQSSEMDPPYRTLSSSLRRYGTLASLEHFGSLEDGKIFQVWNETCKRKNFRLFRR